MAFDTTDLADTDLIKKILSRFLSTPADNNVYQRRLDARVALAGSRYNLEQAESKKFFRFLETTYDNDDRRHNSGEVFSVQLASNLLDILNGIVFQVYYFRMHEIVISSLVNNVTSPLPYFKPQHRQQYYYQNPN
ncbi:MAG: hypothetical protein GY850_24375 [bacterium]|nr:hypothetical protein [bacterium]